VRGRGDLRRAPLRGRRIRNRRRRHPAGRDPNRVRQGSGRLARPARGRGGRLRALQPSRRQGDERGLREGAAETARRRAGRCRQGDREGAVGEAPADALPRDPVGDSADQPEPPAPRPRLGPLQRDPVPEAGAELSDEPADLPAAARGLLGHWTLEAWTGEDAAGAPVAHGGAEPSGDLVYLPSGRMAVQISYDGRESLGSRDLGAGDDAGQAAAYRTYNAYAGRFSVPEPGTVVHHVEQALHPDQAGMDKRRSYRLDGDVLTLRTQPVVTA